MSVLVVDWLRLSVAVAPPFAATCAPLADEVVVCVDRSELSVTVDERSELSVVERSELSMYDRSALSVVVTDWLRLSDAVLPLFAATCAPDAPLLSVRVVERSELSVVVVERLELSVADRSELSLLLVERFELSVVDRFELSVIDRSELSVVVVERFDPSVVVVERLEPSVLVVVELSVLVVFCVLSGLNDPSMTWPPAAWPLFVVVVVVVAGSVWAWAGATQASAEAEAARRRRDFIGWHPLLAGTAPAVDARSAEIRPGITGLYR